jgi:hypothetical protein
LSGFCDHRKKGKTIIAFHRNVDPAFVDPTAVKIAVMPGHNFRLGSFAFGFAQPAAQSRNGSESIELHHCNSNANPLPSVTKLQLRVAVFGASTVGKTALLHQFLYNQFPESHTATLDQLYHTECKLIKGLRHT